MVSTSTPATGRVGPGTILYHFNVLATDAKDDRVSVVSPNNSYVYCSHKHCTLTIIMRRILTLPYISLHHIMILMPYGKTDALYFYYFITNSYLYVLLSPHN